MKKNIMILAVVAIASMAMASPLGSAYIFIFNDGADGGITPGQDVSTVSMSEDSTNYYFKIETVGALTLTGDNYAGIYNLYFDLDQNQSTGWDGNNFTYFADSVSGFELVADSHISASVSSLSNVANHFHTLSVPDGIDAGANTSWNTVNTFTFKIDKSYFAGDFCVCAATLDNGSSAPTYDTTAWYCVPEPATMAVLGVLGLVMRKRKN